MGNNSFPTIRFNNSDLVANETSARRLFFVNPKKKDVHFTLVNCATLDAARPVSYGYGGMAKFVLNVTNQNFVYIFVSERHNFYFAHMFGLYGSSFNYDSLPPGNRTFFYKDYTIHRTHWKRIEGGNFPCTKDTTAPRPEICIGSFIEHRVGCRNAFQRGPSANPSLPECRTMQQYRQWAEWTFQVINGDEHKVHNLTGCLPPCDSFSYTLKTQNGLMSMEATQRSMTMFARFTKGSYKQLEEYFVYTGNNLVADIGGYLGLLLGHSLYSIVCSLEDLKKIYMKFLFKWGRG